MIPWELRSPIGHWKLLRITKKGWRWEAEFASPYYGVRRVRSWSYQKLLKLAMKIERVEVRI
jgi:hypothetical protein